VKEDSGAVLAKVLIETQPGRCSRKQAYQCCLADVQRLASEIIPVQFDQVEGIEEHAIIIASVPDALKVRDAIVAAGDRLPIDDAGT
jgi:hypothetical protein